MTLYKNTRESALGLNHAGGQPRTIGPLEEFVADASEVPQSLLDAGALAEIATTVQSAGGLTSPEQAVEVHKALVAVPGVHDATVRSEVPAVAVRYDPARTSIDAIVAVLKAHDCDDDGLLTG